ncbi:unnamed protein product [Paramecium sonneborni]|uniref:Uncharacterized protein n=1 Tax=Paramecium sonneborni TaxID=65129 RepID=A0A8S1RTQ3_9CILI|nr:unnamed protein product [Paramecium sonneborni]
MEQLLAVNKFKVKLKLNVKIVITLVQIVMELQQRMYILLFKTGNICICQDSYYEQISTLSCQKCDLSCLTCKNSATYCLSSDTTYTRGFYFNTFSKQCKGIFQIIIINIACAIKCKECQTFSQCIECEDLTRYFEQDNMNCPYKDGYYENKLEKCALNVLLVMNYNIIDNQIFINVFVRKGFMIMVNQFVKNVLINVLHVMVKEIIVQVVILIEIEQINLLQKVVLVQVVFIKMKMKIMQIFIDCNNKQNVIQNIKLVTCSISKTSKRYSLSNNCTQVDYQKCSNHCKHNCLSCFSNLRNTPFFVIANLDSLKILLKIVNLAKINVKQARNPCQNVQFVKKVGYPYCIQCEYQCKTYIDSPLNCLIIKGDHINIPQCICPDGFYDDFINELYQFVIVYVKHVIQIVV